MEDLKQQLEAAAQAGISENKVNDLRAEANSQALGDATKEFDSDINPALRGYIWKALGWLAVTFVVLVLFVGNVALFILFPLAEYEAVRAGGLAIGVPTYIATLNAVVVVLGVLVMAFLSNLLRAGLSNKTLPQATLRHSFEAWRYWLGLSEEAPERTQAEELYLAARGTVRALQFTIVFLGILGRLFAAIDKDAVWFNAVWGILTKSSLIEFMGFVGTISLTMVLLWVIDFAVGFVFSIFTSMVGTLEVGKHDKVSRSNFLAERSAAYLVESLTFAVARKREVNTRRAERKAKEVSSS